MITIDKPLDLNDPVAERFLSNLQGHILKGHGRPHASLLFLRFKRDDAETYGQAGSIRSDAYGAARAALVRFAEQYARSALQQLGDSQTHQQQLAAGLAVDEQLIAMVLLSAKGYRILLTDNRDRPTDGAFQKGMRGAPALNLLDSQWEQPYKGDIHAMILLAHENVDRLQTIVGKIKEDTKEFFEIFHDEHGHQLTLPGQERIKIEHFGFADGLSDPRMILQDIEKHQNDKSKSAANLNLVLVPEGRPQEDGTITYGSYMVFYKLQQNVALFRRMHAVTGPQAVGRQSDGTPLVPFEGGDLNNFNYEKDPQGKLCPITAHIRKMNDRTGPAKIVRRGITYGTRPDLEGKGGDPPQGDVGLLFMSFQCDIAQTFEALQKQAADSEAPDALIGPMSEGDSLVTPKGGEYFFAPSLPFLRGLATLRQEQIKKFKDAWAKLLNDDKMLNDFGIQWKVSPLAAAQLIGIEPNDFATLYASYLKASPENMKKVRDGRGILERGPSHTPEDIKTEKLSQALNSLLDPAVLKDFIDLWSTNPAAALHTINLSREDMLDFYAYLRKQQVELEWPLWL